MPKTIKTFRGALLDAIDGPTTMYAIIMRCRSHYPRPHDATVENKVRMRVKSNLKRLAADGVVRKLHGGETMKNDDVWVYCR